MTSGIALSFHSLSITVDRDAFIAIRQSDSLRRYRWRAVPM